MDFRQLIIEEANRQKIDPNLALAVAQTESSFNPNAVSPKGAQGLFQLMPGTAKDLGVDPTDPQQNIRGGLTYLRQQLDAFGDPKLALAAYNAGPGNVRKAGGVPNFPETQNYVSKIMDMLVPSAQAATLPNQQPAPQTQQQAPEQTQEQPQPKKPFHERVVGGYGKALDNNDFEAAEVIVGEAKNRFKQGIDKALANNDKEAADFIRQKQLDSFTQIYDRSAKSGNLKLTETLRQEIRANQKLTNDTAEKDPIFTKNARILYREAEGKNFEGSDKDAADWLKNYMGQFNYNLAVTGKRALDVKNYSDQGKVAFLQAMNDYDSMPASLEGAGRLAKGVATDPTTYAGLGIGAVASKTVGRSAAKEGVKLAIQQGIEQSLAKRIAGSTTAKLAAEGAVYSGAGNLLEQSARVNADGQDGINVGEAALATGLGAGAGVVGGKVIDRLTGRKAITDFAKRAGSEEGARLDAEIIKDLQRASGNSNLRGNELMTQSLNEIENSYRNNALNLIKKVDPKVLQDLNVQDALTRKRTITPDELQKIRGNTAGDALADAIEKAQRARSLTGQTAASGGVGNKLLRMGIEYGPSAALSATLSPIPLLMTTQGLRGFAQRLTGKQSRAEVAQGLLKPSNVKAADRILGELGGSQSNKSLDALSQMANQAVTRRAADAQMKVQAKAEAKASTEAVGKAIQEDFGRGVLQDGGGHQTLRDFVGFSDGDLARGFDEISQGLPKELAKDLEKFRRNETIPSKSLYLIQKRLKEWGTNNGVEVVQKRDLSQGVLSGVTVDAQGVPIQNPFAYKATAAGNQKRITETLGRVQSSALGEQGRLDVSNAVAKISTVTTKGEAKAIMDAAIAGLSDAEKKEARKFLEPLVNQIKKD
jgi:hypothetical protein